MGNIGKIWTGMVLFCLVLMGCASHEIIPESLLAPLCTRGDPGICYKIGDAYRHAEKYDEALGYFKQGCSQWDRLKDSASGDKENSPLAISETCCLLAGYTSQLTDDYHGMLAFDSFGCNNSRTTLRESACDGADTAISVINADNPLNATVANEIMDLETAPIQGVQQVDAAK